MISIAGEKEVFENERESEREDENVRECEKARESERTEQKEVEREVIKDAGRVLKVMVKKKMYS